jgi:hypothetical protein
MGKERRKITGSILTCYNQIHGKAIFLWPGNLVSCRIIGRRVPDGYTGFTGGSPLRADPVTPV